LGQIIRMPERPQIEERVAWVQTHGLTDEPDAVLGSARPAEYFRQCLVAVGVVRRECDGTLCLGDGAVVRLLPQIDLSQQTVGVGKRVVQSDGPLGQLTGPLESLPLSTPKKLPALEKRPAQACVGPRILGIELESLGEEPPRLGTASARRMLSFVMAPKHQVVGLEHTRWRPADTNLLSLGDLDGQGSDDLLCDLVLQDEDVAHFAVVALGPDVIPRSRVHQLSGDPHSMTRTLDAAFQDIPHTEVTAHLAYVHRFALVREDRVPGDHEQTRHL